MKVEIPVADIERSGVQRKIACSLKPTAQSFQMLARQYSNPIRAIIQELSANAADSHIRAGKADVPFLVKLPNKMDNHIRFRDFGVSMSPDVVENVYANYMESDKKETNEETGYFGIGSKTPLAYEHIESFNITTYLNGVMRMYTMCYNEVGLPELNVYNEYTTDEPNGVEISFAVIESDFRTFEEEAKHVFSFFKVPPTVKGVADFKSYDEQLDFCLEADDKSWRIVSGYSEHSYVIMGNIGYKVTSYGPGLPKHRSLLQNGVRLEVPIGSVSITPSREGLEYNSRTIAFLDKAFDAVKSQVVSKTQEILDKSRTRFDACCKAMKYRWVPGATGNAGINLSKNWKIDHKFSFPSAFCVFTKKGGKAARKNTDGGNLYITNDMSANKVLVLDDRKLYDRKARHYIEHNEGRLLVVEGITKQEALATLGADEHDEVVILASDLPRPPKKEATSGYQSQSVKSKHVRFVKTSNYGRCWAGDWSDEEIDFASPEEFVYVNLFRHDADYSYESSNRLLTRLGVSVPKLIGIHSKNGLLKKRSNLCHAKDYVLRETKRLDTEYMRECVAKYKAVQGLELNDCFLRLAATGDGFSPHNEGAAYKYYSLLKEVELSYKEREMVKDFLLLAERAGYCLNSTGNKYSSKLFEAEASCLKEYELVTLYLLDLRGCNRRDELLLKTINCIDSKKKEK